MTTIIKKGFVTKSSHPPRLYLNVIVPLLSLSLSDLLSLNKEKH